MVARAKVFPGAENTATRRLVSEDTEHELGSLMTVLSPGLNNTVMFLVESQEMSGNLSGVQSKETERMSDAARRRSLKIFTEYRIRFILNLNIFSFVIAFSNISLFMILLSNARTKKFDFYLSR